MNISDLSPYKAGPDREIGFIPLAVGWLKRGQNFPTGPTPPDFVGKLLAYCFEVHTINHQRRTTPCAVSGDCPRVIPPEKRGQQLARFGEAEIRVIGESDIYAAPTLIYHYVVAHGYRPPEPFIEAVCRGPAAGSAEHRALIRALG